MKPIKRIVYRWIERKFLAGCSNFNSLATRKLCRSKKLARRIFTEHSIPHARGEVFYGLLTPFRFAGKFGFPLVIKPNVGGFSRGSHFPISSYGQLFKAALQVKIWWPSSVVERYLEGKNYRILVTRDRVLSVIRRYPPQVVGDGRASIEELIDRENRVREEMRLYPVNSPIAKSGKVIRYLAKSGKTLKTIPAPDETVQLHHRISLAVGGVVETIDKKSIPRENLQLFLQIPELLQANILGIDAIFAKGIESSHREQEVIFLEINSRPYIKMHDYPRHGKRDDIDQHLRQLTMLPVNDKDLF